MARVTLGKPVLVVHEAGDPEPQEVFRIVRTRDRGNPTFIDSLTSHHGLDRPPRGAERRSAVLHMGLSTWGSAQRAAAVARRWPVIGEFVAHLSLQPGRGFNIAQTNLPGHYTVWGRPLQLREVVVEVLSVEEI